MLQLGYNDISGQIRSALDQFEGLRIVPFSVILIILTAYWLVIGLFDWFFVHKVLKRPILTWLTFPLWIVLFSFLTYSLAASGRPVEMKCNSLLIFDVDFETGVHRTSTWNSVYTPTDRRYDWFDSISSHYSWNGLPGSGLGGMAPKTVSPTVWQVGSEQISYSKFKDVPIQARSTKSFFGQQMYFCHPNMADSFCVQLSDEEGIPIGTIEVPQDASLSLQNVLLVYGRWALELGEIQAGQTIRITKTTPRRELRDLLIPARTLENDHLRRVATYNPQSTDLEYIVRVMSLHRALGGYEATGLHNAYQPSLDMSELLSVDRALLLGTRAPTDVRSEDGSMTHTTMIFRQSLPITLTELSPRLKIERYDPSGGALDERIRSDHIDDPGWRR
jgi:hypothetical protein